MFSIALRQLYPSDLTAFLKIHCDPKTTQFNPAGPYTPLRATELLQTWCAHWEQHGFGYWTVTDSERPEQVIGFGGIMRKKVGHLDGFNIYFRLAPTAWGKGYASQIALASLDLAFTELKASEVLGLVHKDNLASRRTLERAGFVQFTTINDAADNEPSLIYRALPGSAAEPKA
ncbi:GNAT family N-acetyltransferase [Undibacterium sp.]|uniref:GNAT family N-acetyltransferase n=1 Tax=Undibacterium sp. TaxID=1914977 RepID=UPI0025FE9C6D|nr:GNAT family N-acetyltransferase [Undibacterium sp.]